MPFPADLVPPDRLIADDYVLRPITVADAQLDHEAVMASRELLRRWEQSTWPEDDFTVDDNRADMELMERRHADGYAFGYTMLTPDESECLGCVYVFPHDAKFLAAADIAALGERRWDEIGAAVLFWVRADRLDGGLDDRLLADLRRWFADAWAVAPVVFMTSELFTEQVALLESSGLRRCFTIAEPGKPGLGVAFADAPPDRSHSTM